LQHVGRIYFWKHGTETPNINSQRLGPEYRITMHPPREWEEE